MEWLASQGNSWIKARNVLSSEMRWVAEPDLSAQPGPKTLLPGGQAQAMAITRVLAPGFIH